MGEVVSFDKAKEGGDETIYTLTGPAICTHCKHQWQCVTPAGSHDSLECPECSLHMGVVGAPVVPREFWECDCGSDLFYLTQDGAMCRTCGLVAVGWVE
jgi:hypothetical protein